MPPDKTSLPAIAVTTMLPLHPVTAPPILPMAAVMGMMAYPVASVSAPMNEHDVLMGSDGDLSCNSNNSVSNAILFCIPHLVWHCAIDDPASPICLHVDALIDYSFPVVLVNEELATCLQLQFHPLSQSFSVSSTFLNDSPTPCLISLTQWIKLKLHDHSNYYSA